MTNLRLLTQRHRQLTLISILIFFIATNLMLLAYPIRIDLSKQKAYSLSKSTKEIIKRFSKQATISVYISSDIPTRLMPLRRDVIDFLKEYERASSGNINVLIKDPKNNSSIQQEALRAGLPQLQFSEVNSDQYKVTSSFFGIVMSSEGKNISIPQVVTTSSLEYDLTSALYKMGQVIPERIALINFPKVDDQRNDSFSTLKRSLDKQFSLIDVGVSDDSYDLNIEKAKVALLLVDGLSSISSTQISLFQNYLKRGGSLMVFIDGVAVSDGLEVADPRHNMFSFLRNNGIILERTLVLSQSAQSATFATGLGAFVVNYPFWITTNSFLDNETDFANIGLLAFPWASSLRQVDPSNSRVLVESQSSSWIQSGNFELIPNNIITPKKQDFRKYPLVIESYNNGGNLMVISSARFPREQFIGKSSSNIEFIVNVLNRYVSDGELSGIRARENIAIPIRPLTNSQELVVKCVIVFAPMLFLGLSSLINFYRRKKYSL